jgi:hypothetical protein
MDKVLKHIQMEPDTMDPTFKIKNMERELTDGLITRNIKVIGLKMKLTVLEYIYGKMDGSTMENGSMVKCVAMEFTFTLMVLDMMVSTKKMKKMVLDIISGKTADNI